MRHHRAPRLTTARTAARKHTPHQQPCLRGGQPRVCGRHLQSSWRRRAAPPAARRPPGAGAGAGGAARWPRRRGRGGTSTRSWPRPPGRPAATRCCRAPAAEAMRPQQATPSKLCVLRRRSFSRFACHRVRQLLKTTAHQIARYTAAHTVTAARHKSGKRCGRTSSGRSVRHCPGSMHCTASAGASSAGLGRCSPARPGAAEPWHGVNTAAAGLSPCAGALPLAVIHQTAQPPSVASGVARAAAARGAGRGAGRERGAQAAGAARTAESPAEPRHASSLSSVFGRGLGV